jgi:hypothetical protein
MKFFPWALLGLGILLPWLATADEPEFEDPAYG